MPVPWMLWDTETPLGSWMFLGESPHDLVSFVTYTFGDFFVDFCRGSFALCRHFVVLEVEKSTAWLYGFMYFYADFRAKPFGYPLGSTSFSYIPVSYWRLLSSP